MSQFFDTTVFCDPQGEAAARVYVVAAPTVPLPDDELAELRIAGRIVGPTCRYSSTLQASIPFKHRGLTRWGDRTALVGEAVVPDPCYWSSELPFLYRAVGEVTGPQTSPSAFGFDQTFGLRFVGTARNRLTLNGQVWVPRGISVGKVLGDTPLDFWRVTGTSMVVDDPSDEFCSKASEAGVSVIARIKGTSPKATIELQRLSRFPAVVICGLQVDGFEDDARSREVSKNIVLAQRQDYFKDLIPISSDAAAFILEAARREMDDCISFANEMASHPIIFQRQIGSRRFEEARQECDRLQRDLAGRCDAAGYFV